MSPWASWTEAATTPVFSRMITAVAGAGTTYTLAAAVSTTSTWISPPPAVERISAQEHSTATASEARSHHGRPTTPMAPKPSRYATRSRNHTGRGSADSIAPSSAGRETPTATTSITAPAQPSVLNHGMAPA